MVQRSWIAGLSLGLVLVACDDDDTAKPDADAATTSSPTDATSATTEDTSVPTEVEDDTSVPTEVEDDTSVPTEVEDDTTEDVATEIEDDTSEPDTSEPERVYDPIPGAWDDSLDFWLPGLQASIGPRAYAMVKNATTGEVFVGGIFDTVGPMDAKNVVRWTAADGFSPMADGLELSVHALALAPDGTLFAGGRAAGGGGIGIPSPGPISAWDGTSWAPVGWVDAFSPVWAMAHGAHGLVVGGEFTAVQNGDFSEMVEAPYLAYWDGAAWNAFEEGSPDGVVTAIAYHAGELCIGGNFTKVGAVDARNIACLGESGWHALGDGLNSQVNALYSESETSLMAGGYFSFGDPAGPPTEFFVGLGRFTTGGSAWAPVAGGVINGSITNVWTITPAGDDGLWIGGNFRHVNAAAPMVASNIALLDGNNWLDVGGLTNEVGATLGSEVGPRAIVPDGAGYIIAGLFSTAGGEAAVNIVRYEDKNFAPIGDVPSPGGIPGLVNSLAFGPNGALYVGGEFSAAGGVTTPRVAKLVFPTEQGIVPQPPARPHWESLGDGLDDTIWVIHPARNGKVYAGGRFSAGFARLDDTTVERAEWDFPGQFNGAVYAIEEGLAEDDDNNIYVGGDFTAVGTTELPHIARFTGSTFQPIGVGLNDRVNAILAGPSGELYAGGFFKGTADYDAEAGTGAPLMHLAKWTGTGWEDVGGGVEEFGFVRDLAWWDGKLLVVGQFKTAGEVEVSSIATWDGGVWEPVGSGDEFFYSWGGALPLSGVAVQDNGFFLMGSLYELVLDETPINHIIWWNGSAWEPMGEGFNDLSEGAAIAPDGRSVFVGGPFLKANNKTSLGLARWTFDDTVGVPVEE